MTFQHSHSSVSSVLRCRRACLQLQPWLPEVEGVLGGAALALRAPEALVDRALVVPLVAVAGEVPP